MQGAYEVHNALGPGFPESIYEEATNGELVRLGVKLERQKELVEYKAVSEIARIHKQKALSYLKATKKFAPSPALQRTLWHCAA